MRRHSPRDSEPPDAAHNTCGVGHAVPLAACPQSVGRACVCVWLAWTMLHNCSLCSRPMSPGHAHVRGPWAAASAMAVAGRQTCVGPADVIWLRRIHRRKGDGVIQEATVRVLGVSITSTDCELWRMHGADVLHDPVPGSASPCACAGGKTLLHEALAHAPESAAAWTSDGQ